MYLISANPHSQAGEYNTFSETVSYAGSKEVALEVARKTASKYGRGYIFKLEKFVVPIGDLPVQAYSMNEKGEVLPCD
jgi:hypothetical protein